MSTSTTNRRDFLKQGTIGTAGVSIGAMGFAPKKLHLLSVGAQRWCCFFLSRPKSDFGAGADRKLDFQGDRIREGFSGGITPSRNALPEPNCPVRLEPTGKSGGDGEEVLRVSLVTV